MGLNRVSNPAKLRRLGRLVGEPVVRAYAKWFDGHVLLVIGESGRSWSVDQKDHIEEFVPERPFVLYDNGLGGG